MKRLLILVEAQSTWTTNIIIRSLMYLMTTYQDYFKKTSQNIYKSKKVAFPKPELYVIFTGEREVENIMLAMYDEKEILREYIESERYEAAQEAAKEAKKDNAKEMAIQLLKEGLSVEQISYDAGKIAIMFQTQSLNEEEIREGIEQMKKYKEQHDKLLKKIAD